MRKRTYYLFKVILPDLLLTIMFILLLNVLGLSVNIIDSKYVIFFALVFTSIDYIIKRLFDLYQISVLKKITLQDMLSSKKIMYMVSFLVVLTNLFTIGAIYITKLLFNKFIVFEVFYAWLSLALLIIVFKIVLNKLFNFDKILLNTNIQKDIDDKYSNLIDNILNEEEISKIEDPKEKEKEVAKRLEEIFSQMIKDKNKNKEKEENDEE